MWSVAAKQWAKAVFHGKGQNVALADLIRTGVEFPKGRVLLAGIILSDAEFPYREEGMADPYKMSTVELLRIVESNIET
ncbi:MAG: hypothetical protein NT094_02675 [Candidatus Staskawiczbacteria bacterium]|nr:hypothetical protein [Candidatus Staskawiczbacteria bacterium]